MKTITILSLSLLLTLLSCDKKDKTNNTEKQNNNYQSMNAKEIKELINLQKNANFEDFRPDNPYKPSEIDLNTLIPLVKNGLANAGFKTISDEEFKNKVNDIIKSNKIKNHNDFTTLFANTLDRTTKTLDDHEFDFDLTNNQFIVKKYNFIIPMLFLENVVKMKDDNNYSIVLPQNIIARNKYLFNDSKADLTWLLSNDKDFLKTLVISFGYDKEAKINKMILEDFYAEFDDKQKIGFLFFTKNLNNNFEIRQGLIEYVYNNTTVKDNRFIYALDDYTYALYGKNLDKIYGDDDPAKIFNAIEKANIVAIIASIEIPAIEKFKSENPELWNYTESALYNIGVSHPEVFEIIKKQNYFGIKGMKEILENTSDEIELNADTRTSN